MSLSQEKRCGADRAPVLMHEALSVRQQSGELVNISTYRKDLLFARGLERPTGSPLYTYRFSATEYGELEAGLRHFLALKLRSERLGEIVQNHSWIPSLFVLYSAEWWRREYDGSNWSWEPILRQLRADPRGWTPTQRSACVEEGLADWRIKLSQSRGFRFLSSVALQGGLPMKLLAGAQGRLGSLLSRVLRDAAASRAQPNEIEEWIKLLGTNLPETYRRPEIFRLLAEIIVAVLELRSQMASSSNSDPVLTLDRTDPKWRDRFPLPVEDAHARGLLEQLIKEAVISRQPRALVFVTAQRSLEADGANWTLQSTWSLPNIVEGSLIWSTFGVLREVPFPRSLSVQSPQSTMDAQLNLTRYAGRDTFRVAGRLPVLTGAAAATEQWMTLTLANGMRKTALAHKGDWLAPDLPWLFAIDDRVQPQFIRQGSGTVPGSTALVCIPSTWRGEVPSGSEVLNSGSVNGLHRSVLRFRGSIKVFDEKGLSFHCRCGDVEEDKYIGWDGKRSLDVEWLSPKEAFRGTPRLCFHSGGMTPLPVSTRITWRSNGKILGSLIDAVGPVEGILLNGSEVEWRSRVVLLGRADDVRTGQHNTPMRGVLHFDNWRLAHVTSETATVSVTDTVEGPSLSATLEYTGEGSPPEFCDLSLYWMHNAQRARIRLPFPASGAHCFDAQGQRLPQNAAFSVEAIFGVRLVAFVARTDSAFLAFTLCHRSQETSSAKLRLISPELGSRIEVRLIDHLARLHRMLADVDDIDSYVRVELQAGSSPPTALKIARYAASLDRDLESHHVYLRSASEAVPERLGSLVLEAIPLDNPGEEPTRLEPLADERHGFVWDFPRQLRTAPWLIVPGRTTAFEVRPLLWAGGDATQNNYAGTELQEALRADDRHERAELLSQAINSLASDFGAAGWQVVEMTACQLPRLPLCALDLWRAFARSAVGQASLALRSHRLPTRFLYRFITELPLVLESVPLKVWTDAMRAFLAFEKGEDLTRTTLASRVDEIASLQPSLRVLLEVAQTLATGEPTRDVALVMRSRINFSKGLFSGDDSQYQELLRDTADHMWPTELQSEISLARRSAIDHLVRVPSYPSFRDSVINLPLFLGFFAATNVPVADLVQRRLSAIRHYQDFCPEWFTQAFDLTVAGCIAAGAIPELENSLGAKALL
jgi:hypothetical protein